MAMELAAAERADFITVQASLEHLSWSPASPPHGPGTWAPPASVSSYPLRPSPGCSNAALRARMTSQAAPGRPTNRLAVQSLPACVSRLQSRPPNREGRPAGLHMHPSFSSPKTAHRARATSQAAPGRPTNRVVAQLLALRQRLPLRLHAQRCSLASCSEPQPQQRPRPPARLQRLRGRAPGARRGLTAPSGLPASVARARGAAKAQETSRSTSRGTPVPSVASTRP